MTLEEIRKRIDRLDVEVVHRLRLRSELALLSCRFKDRVIDEEREKEVLRNVERTNRKLLDSSFIRTLFEQIIKECRRVQSEGHLLAGFQGEHGAFSEQALAVFNPKLIPFPCPEFMDVFEGVQRGLFDFGIIPVENSLQGSLHEVTEILIETELKIVGEVVLPIHHCLLTVPDVGYRDIRVVYSHPQALAQCRAFLQRHGFELKPFYDTAGAARWLAAERLPGAAVIAGETAAEIYGLEIIKSHIEDDSENCTRFVVLSARDVETGGDKCSIAFTTPHRAGALAGVLSLFAQAGINLTRVESKPVRGRPKQWAFLLDFQGDSADPKVIKVLDQVREKASSFKLLGCYPEAKS